MLNPKPKVLEDIRLFFSTHAEAKAWLVGVKNFELERLPLVLDNNAIAQGRVQVLQELINVVIKSPEGPA